MPAQINLHELINQPGYGKAEKALRKAGMWRLTPEEKMRNALDRISDIADDIEDASTDMEYAVKEALHAMEGNK